MWLSVAVMMFIEGMVCMIWQINYKQEPIGDQLEVWNMGELLARHQGTNGNLQYFITYPQQKSIAYIMSAFIRIFGNNGLSAYRIFCMFCTILIVLFGALLAYKASGSEEAGTASAIMLTEFVPLILYSVFIYGTIPAICFTLTAFYCTLCFIQTCRIRYLIPELISCCLAYSFYSSTLIAVAAIFVILILSAMEWGKRNKKAVAAALLSAIFAFGICSAVTQAAGNAFMTDTGVSPEEDALPYSSWILMGIQSTDSSAGPGGYDGSTLKMFDDNERNEEKTDEQARSEISDVISEYLQGDRSLDFFTYKTISQWTDPWFSSLTMTVYSPDLTSATDLGVKITVKDLKILQLCLLIFMQSVYLSSLLCLFHTIRCQQFSKGSLLFCLYFIGGFLFQLFWETKGRYCMPYFIGLIILSGIEIADVIRRTIKYNKNSVSLSADRT